MANKPLSDGHDLPKVENVRIDDNAITFTWDDGTKTVLDSLPILKKFVAGSETGTAHNLKED